MNTLKISSALTIAALAAATFVAVPSKASADDRSSCQRRVEKAQEHYRKESHEHGKHSHQADNARAKLNQDMGPLLEPVPWLVRSAPARVAYRP